MNKYEELENALSLFHYKLDIKRELYGRKSVCNVILKISDAENVYKVLNQYESDDNKHRQNIHELDLQTVKLLKQLEATEKELEIYKKLHQKYQYLNENTNDYDLNVDEVTTIHDDIYELEEKLSKVGSE